MCDLCIRNNAHNYNCFLHYDKRRIFAVAGVATQQRSSLDEEPVIIVANYARNTYLCRNQKQLNINYMEQLQVIQSKIYEIRGQKVMLDKDLAAMYGVEVRILNQAVKRNIDRFPSDFMFQLSNDEWMGLKSQFVISSWGGIRKLPYAFTEMGVAMLSSVLRSSVAIQVNINIMRAFVAVRQMIALPPTDKLAELQSEMAELKSYVEEILSDQNDINEETAMQLELILQKS